MTEIKITSNTRFLLVRPDKIGDVLLTTPAVTSLRKKFPESFIGFLCRSYTAPLLENNPAISTIIKEDEYSFLNLVKKLKSLKFDVAIHFYVETKSVLATTLAGIPYRVGPFSKLSSLLLNHKISQHRSRSEKHEAQYNLDLVHHCGADGLPSSPVLFLTDDEKKKGKEIIASVQVNPEKPPIIIHPGSAGSVQNWPLEHFLKLAQQLVEEFGDVIFTGGKGEETILERAKNLTQPPHPYIHILPAGKLTLRELASVISNSKLMISNSTGPLHIATALDIPTLSFYPRIPKVTSARRWRPFEKPHLHRVLSPQNDLDPMSSISVETAYQSVKKNFQ